MNLKYSTKIRLLFLLFSFFAIIITGGITYNNAIGTLELVSKQRLTSIREIKKRQIQNYFDNLMKQTITISDEYDVINAAKMKTLLENNVVSHSIQATFSKFIIRYKYVDILIINEETGDITYALKNRNLIYANVKRLSGFDNLKSVYNAVSNAPDSEIASVSDFAPAQNKIELPTAYSASPIFDKNVRVGTLIIQISINDINEIMTSGNNWDGSGFGKTGETYLVGQDLLMRSDSRLLIQKPDQYFKRMKNKLVNDSLINRIKQSSTSVLIQDVKTIATTEATAGVTDTKTISDYTGMEVLSSYTTINISNLKWIVIAEIDTEEAFESIASLRENMIMFALFLAIGASIISVNISRNILKPVIRLIRAAEHYKKGDFSYRTDITAKDELGDLAAILNEMAEKMSDNAIRINTEISNRKNTEAELKESQKQLRALSSHIQIAREEERKGIAREIHDELGQFLNTLKLKLHLLKDDVKNDISCSDEKITEVINMVDGTIKTVKRLLTKLRPQLLDDLGLVAAMEWYVKDFEQNSEIKCNFNSTVDECKLPPTLSIAIFRILQETITNVARHSKATTVSIDFIVDTDEIELTVTDNGVGIKEEKLISTNSFGILGMKERAIYCGGILFIKNNDGAGTTVQLKVSRPKE